MRIAVLEAPGKFRIDEVPVPSPGPGEVLIAVGGCGVCASELEAWTGRSSPEYPLCLGHEVSGTVVRTGEGVGGLTVGDTVGVWVTSHGFADYVVAPAQHCFLAGDVPVEAALAEPLACALNAVDLADVRLADDVFIVGAGFMGHLVQQLVQLRGPRQVIVADTRRDALERARDLGATLTVQVGEDDETAAVAAATQGQMADVSFECTGSPAALRLVGDVTRMSGKLALVGFHQGPDRPIPLGFWNWMAFDIKNAHFREPSTILHGMKAGMRLVEAGRLDLGRHVTHRFELADIATAFDTAVEKPAGFVKATVMMDAR